MDYTCEKLGVQLGEITADGLLNKRSRMFGSMRLCPNDAVR
jgi:hypothetical protein